MQAEKKPWVRCENINKYFGTVKVLNDVAFHIREGEVHALIGENGAGKSTLVKILFGVHRQSSGAVYVNEEPVVFHSPRDARLKGMALINQEPMSFPHLTILENIFSGHTPRKKGGVVDYRKMRERAQGLIDDLGFAIDLTRKMSELSVSEMQMVEIIGALSSEAKIIFMDEPTASLTPNEVDNLLGIVDTLRKRGKSVVFISHRLDEIKRIADRVTVLRDGCVVGTFDNDDSLTPKDMIQHMLGCALDELIDFAEHEVSSDAHLQVENLSVKGMFEDISFDVRKGEVLGIGGLMGAGRSEIACTIFGILKKSSGTIKKDGRVLEIKTPVDAIKNGIVLVPEDRHRMGLFLDKNCAYNLTIKHPKKITRRFGFVNKAKERELADESVKAYRIKLKNLGQWVSDLSGGNQQKISLAKWISTESDILILDEPTRGIDVGAKAEVYKMIHQLAGKGKSIILISSEIEELLHLSDRVMVIYEGRRTALLDRPDISRMNVLAGAHGYGQ